MPEFNDTGLQYVIAGNVNAANNWHRDGWPDSINNTLGSAALLATNAGTAISNSSVTTGTGSKSFTLTSSRPWDVGTPIFLVAQDDPDIWIWGQVTANDGVGGITIDSVKNGPTVATRTLWTAIALFILAESLEDFPLSRANGGLGSASNESSSVTCEYPLMYRTYGTFVNPPTPAEDDKEYLVADGATGAWAGEDGNIAKDAVGGWTFRAVTPGAQKIEMANAPSSVGAPEFFDGTSWSYVGSIAVSKVASFLKSNSASVTLTVASWRNMPDLRPGEAQDLFVTFYGSGGHVLTLPAPSLASLGIAGKTVSVMLQEGSLLTVNVSGGGTIGNALTSVTTSTLYRVLTFKCMPLDSGGSTVGHWVQTAASP